MAKVSEETDNNKTVPLDEAISLTGYGIFHILILVTTGGVIMSVIIETMCMMFIIPAAQCDLDLSLTEKGILSSVSFFGVVSSSFVWGYLADTRGRKNVLVISLGISALSTFVGSIVPWDWLFILLRYINGFFIGAASSVTYAYAGEFHDDYYRPKTIALISTFVAFGNMYLPGLAWLILSETWSVDVPFFALNFRPWRLLLIIYGFPSLIFTMILYWLPESPKYLLSQGKHNEALEVLRKMYAMNSHKNPESFKISNIIWDEDTEVTKKRGMLQSVWQQIVPLFRRKLLVKTIVLCTIQFGIFISTSGIIMWYPEILNEMSAFAREQPDEQVYLCTAIQYSDYHDTNSFNSTQVTTKACKDFVNTEVFLVSLMIGVAYVFTYVFNSCVINVFGKKKLMVGFISMTTACGFAAQFAPDYTVIQILVGIFLLGGSAIGLTNAIAVDLFPTQFRAMAFAISLMCGRIGAVVGTNIVGPLFYNFCDYIFILVAADHIVIIILVLLLPLQKSLSKVQT